LDTLKKIILNDHYGSWIGAIFFTFWIAQRVYFYDEQLFQLNLYALIWWLITFQFFLFIVSYLTRREARVHARGFIESIFPFFCAAMPFSLLVKHPYLPKTYSIVYLKSLSILLIIGGTLVIIAGIIFLRKSFSIMTEVRKPVFTGIYRATRHPMYMGSMMTTLGTLFQNFGWLNIIFFITFCSCQVYRSIREENKIMITYPEYRKYACDVGWIWKLGRRK
jgi:protein-S-isoprenylcysteine O-methyltransferase Ste14